MCNKDRLTKAYESVGWNFLFDTMLAMEIPKQYVPWIIKCARTARYTVVISGSLEGYFPGRRGLRQGDPISPYMFLVITEALQQC